jgi:hypothetical protein
MQRGARGNYTPGREALQKVTAPPIVVDSGTWALNGGLLTLISKIPPAIPPNASDSLKVVLATTRDTTVYVTGINGATITLWTTFTRQNTRNNLVTTTQTNTLYRGVKQ